MLVLNRLSIYVLLLVLTGCSVSTGRYQQANDSTPTRLPTKTELQDPIPRLEPKSRGGNKSNYQVRGKNYHVLDSAHGFTQTGTASWYGNKFHGHLTSNGEIYDMYSMSAAHKNLPLPTYLKVTNLSNHKTVIVRVNDRGPFHQDRIIDLSYSAAYKLDMLKSGTARVKIEAITTQAQINQHISPSMSAKSSIVTTNKTTVHPINPVAPLPKARKKYEEVKGQLSRVYIQVFATKNQQSAKSTALALATLYQQNVVFPEQQGVYRVQMGPFKDDQDLSEILSNLKSSGYPNAYRRKILQ